MKEFFSALQSQGLFGLVGFAVIVFILILFFLIKSGIIKFRNSNDTPLPKPDEKIKQLIRDQSAETRKVVYEMKQQQEVHQAVVDNTLAHFEKGIDKMVGVLSEVQQDIAKFLSERKHGKG